MLPTFSLDALIPEPMPKKPAKTEVTPCTPIPLFTALTGGSVKSESVV